jgi:hypothetical protein
LPRKSKIVVVVNMGGTNTRAGQRSGFNRKKRKVVREGIVLTHGKRCPSVVSGTFLVEIGTGEPVEMGRDFDQPTLLPSKYLSSKAIAHQAQG